MAFHITIKRGNLLDEPDGDVIVNPSNTRLSLGSGVSGAFALACGTSLQEAMTAALQKRGRLSKGDVVPTPPGGCSRFRTVMHAAVMDYNPDALQTVPTLDDIRNILVNICRWLADEALSDTRRLKLVMPLMGTGVGGLDKRDVLRLYRDCFSDTVRYECDVVLYAHSESDEKLMRQVLREMI
jgi:O-acetyl-ADP-ribose deacetylase